jgi:cysteine desulfurase
MGVPFTAAHGSIRFSLGIYNTKEDIDHVIEKLPPVIERLREISPFWQEYKKGKKPSSLLAGIHRDHTGHR